jgi:hypothetical protein
MARLGLRRKDTGTGVGIESPMKKNQREQVRQERNTCKRLRVFQPDPLIRLGHKI